MFTSFSALALFVAAVVAQSGNSIASPGSNEIVPACKPYTIKWDPTSSKTVNIILLRGPSNNVVPIGAPLAEHIANSGSFVWTPSAELEADVTHYGLNLTEDGGSFQYSTQFGISKDESCKSVSSSASLSGYPTASVKSVHSTSAVISTSVYNATSIVITSTSAHVASTGSPVHNSSIIQPTGSLTVPSSLKTTATATPTTARPSASSPVSAGAASPLRAGLGLAGAIAGMVFML